MKQYDEIIHQQVKVGTIEQVSEGSQIVPPAVPGSLVHYLPHHHVLKPSSATTKVRVVHDASSKAAKNLLSLNDCLLRGPVYLSDLCGLLLRFRFHKIAMVADIEKAFFQVGLHPAHRDLTRFLWLKDPTKPPSSGNLITYRFKKIFFGAVSSPFLLGATVKHHLIQDGSEVAQNIAKNLYVDNVISGRDTVGRAKEFFAEARRLFSEIRMNIREWFTNSADLREIIPAEVQGSDQDTRVLGMVWDTTQDFLKFAETSIIDMNVRTKRHLVQAVPQVYDPCGLLSPVKVKGKILIQESWRRQLKWDDPLPDDMLASWNLIREDMTGIERVAIPRFLGSSPSSIWDIHCFCDASSKAYTAVVYVQAPCSSAQLLFSKSKLAPLKPMTLPRLELMALFIGKKLVDFVVNQVSVKIGNIIMWSDSKCALHWLSSSKVLSVFVSNRVRVIKSLKAELRYVPTKLNPADLPTRGCSVSELRCNNLWWHGPEFLSFPKDKWPSSEFSPLQAPPDLEVENEVEVLTAPTDLVPGLYSLDPSRFPDLTHLLRVSVHVHRYIEALKRRVNLRRDGKQCPNPLPGTVPAVTVSEIADQMFRWVNHMQSQCLVPSSNFRNLNRQLQLFRDDVGLLRCGGRMRHADLTEDAKFPLILPKHHPFTQLVIKDAHARVHHSGCLHTIAEVQSKFWVPSLRCQVKSVIRNCGVCRLWEGGPYKCPPHPPLPGFRVSQVPPFDYTGIDYLGPLMVRKCDVAGKAWICLFTCTATRAIHLEVVNDLTTEQFMQSFRRFIAWYGRPVMVISDNAKHFKLSSDVLKQLWSQLMSSKSVQDFWTNHQIEWKFITEYAPWMGGFYERLVGSVERSLKKLLGRNQVSLCELQTLVAEIASVLNSRPLLVSTEVLDQVLTPASLLGKSPKSGLPSCQPGKPQNGDDSYTHGPVPSKEVLVEAWKANEGKLKQFWDIWRTEYLTGLRGAHRSISGPRGASGTEPVVGASVLVHDKTLPRSLWRTGQVVRLVPSSDDVVRTVVVRLAGGKDVTRPVKLLYPLEGDIITQANTRKTDTAKQQNMQTTTKPNQASQTNADSDMPLLPDTKSSGGDIASADSSKFLRPQRKSARVATDRIKTMLNSDLSDSETD